MKWMAKQANPEGWWHLHRNSASFVVDDAHRHHLSPHFLTCSQVLTSATEPRF